mgnify:CR=1 FL=1|jgi:uncharacterized phage protein (TIGR01671 family)
MSREIKFRYRYTDGKSWIMQVFTLEEIINGDPFQAISDNPLLKNYRHDGQDQYIGVKDRRRNCIYEGDIVMWGDLKRASEMWHRYAVVELKPDIQLRIICYKHSKTKEVRHSDNYVFHWGRFAYSGNELKIIGNLYENPELLENPTH